MAKFGKKLLAVAAIGAAAAGAYYYLQKKDGAVPENMDEDEDIDAFDSDVEDADAPKEKRNYVNLDFNTIEEKAKDAVNKVADVASKASVTIGDFVTQAEGKVEEFFNDKKEAADSAFEEAAQAVAEAGEATEEVAETAEEIKEEVEE